MYRRYREERIDDETVVQVPETFVVCPGGRGTDRSIKTVHVLHVEEKTVSTSLFGALPVAASNFGAVLADDGFGGKILVCAPGEVDEGSWYPVQRYSFAEQEWVKTNSAQSLAGCPAYLLDGEVRIAGGQGGYSVSDAVQLTVGNPMTGKQAEYGHLVTPLWKIDAATGVLDKRTPLRRIVSGFSPSPTCYTVDQEKRFLKQNFSGIPVARASDGLSVEFLAVGGTELLGYQSKACVSYRVDSTYGPYVDCETNPTGTVTKCEIFPDTPVPLGECCAVRVTRRRSGTMSVDGDWLVCIGGRYRNEVTEEITLADGSTETVTKTVFRFHERPWSLNLDDKTEGWKNDLFPAIPTPRYNAALSEVVTTTEPVLDENGNLSKETREIRRVFLIGGRTENGLTATIEALNLDTNAWETDWPGLDRRFPPKEIEE